WVRNPEFPKNYMEHIKKVKDRFDIVLVSTHRDVLNAIHEEGLKAIVVYPHISLRYEYMNRYKRRRSPKSLIDFIYDNWTEFIMDLENDNRFETLCIESGVYLSDVIPYLAKLEL